MATLPGDRRRVADDTVEDRRPVVRGPVKRKDVARQDGSRYVQRGKPGGKPARISVQSTAPTDPEVGDLWVDTS